MTRSTLMKKIALNPSSSLNRNPERDLKRTPPSLAVRTKSVKQKKIIVPTPPTLRRSERTKNPYSSSCLKQHPKKNKNEDEDGNEDEEDGVETSSQVKMKRKMNARTYRTTFKNPNRDCHEESNKLDKSTPEGGNGGGAKIDECFKLKGIQLDCEEVSKDGILPSEDDKAKEVRAETKLSEPVKEPLEKSVTLGSWLPSNAITRETSGATERVQSDCCREETIILNENLIRNCVGHDKGEKLISSKRKGTMVDIHSDVSATLVNDDKCNLIADASPSRLCGNTVGSGESCSKRIRPISLSVVQRSQRKLINNVDQPSSKSEGEKLSTGKEGKSGDPVERPQSNNDELRKRQRSLHLLLKPRMAKLCKILRLPDNVKRMVDNCLEYIMNNRQICTEPVSILQAFQLSLCWTAAALLKHKLDRKDSLMLAKRHLNFDCKIEEVNTICGMMRKLKEDFLHYAGNYNVSGSPKASESLNRVYSNTGVAPKVELAYKNISKGIKEGKLLLMQLEEEKKKLKADIEKEMADFERRYKIEWAAIRSCSTNDVMRTENLKVFNSEYGKRLGELRRQHETRLKDLKAKQLEARRKFQESWPQHALLNLAASRKLGTEVEYLQTCDQEQPHNGLVSDLGEGKSLDNIVEAMARTGTGVGLSEAPEINSLVVVSCSSLVELQTPLVKHAGANEMDIMSSEDEPVSRNKCHDIAENEYDGQGNVIPKHSNYRKQCSSGATCMSDEGEGCENFCRESRNGCGQDTVTSVPLSSIGEICDGETLDVPSGEVALAVRKSSSSNDQDEVPTSRQGKLDGTMLSMPICGVSVEIKLNRVSDGMKNMASLNSQSPEEHIPSVTTISLPDCENAAQIHEANDSSGSNNVDPLNSPLSVERIASLNPARIYEADDGNGSNISNIAATLNSLLTDARIADGAIVSLLDREVPVEMPGTVSSTHCPENVISMSPPLSMDQISGGAVNASVSDRDLSRARGTASPNNGPNANITTLLNQLSLEKQHPDGVSLNISSGQIHGEVQGTSHEAAAVSVLDREAPVGMPGTVNCTDHAENVTLLSSSSIDGILSSRPFGASSPSNEPATVSLLNPPSLQQEIPDRVSFSIPDGQIPVIVPETSHEMECQLTDSAVDKSTTLDHQEGVHRTVTENILSQETAGSRLVDLMEPLEQVHPLPSVESSPDRDTAREMLNSLVASPVDIVPANQSNHISLVMEPPEQVQQLPSAEFLYFNQDLPNLPLATGIEHQPTNEDAFSSPIPETSIEVPNQAVEQPDSNLDLDSPMPGGVRAHSSDTSNLSTPSEINDHPIQTATQSISRIVPPLCNDPVPETSIEVPNQAVEQAASNLELDSCPQQFVVHQASNMDIDSPIPGGVRTHSSNTRNLSTPSEINNHPIQTATQSASMIVPPLCNDPVPETSVEVPNQAVERPASNMDLDSPMPGRVRTHSSDTRNNSTPSEINNHPIQTATQSASMIVPPLCNDPVPETSIEVPNQAIEQPASNLELDSRPQQFVVHQASNMDLVTPRLDGVRTHSSDTRNLSTPSEINNHPIQTATQSASMIVPPLCHDPLIHELERIWKLTEQNMKNHEDMKLQLKSDFEKEFEELRRKYRIKLREIEVEFQQTRKNLDTSHNIVLLNKILAEAFRSICMDLRESGAPGMQQDASTAQQLSQLSRQQNSTWPSLVSGPSSRRPPGASLHSSYTTTSSQNMVPPIQAAYNTSGIFSSVSARLPNVNSISSPSGNLQSGGEMRAPAPHLQPYRPSTSVPAPSLCTIPHGMPSQPAPGNIPLTSPTFSHRLPQLTPTTYQSDPHRGHWPAGVGVLPTSNLPAMDSRMDANIQYGIDLQNVLSPTSNMASLNLSRFGTSSSMPANSAHQATSPDVVVCLSDDE